MFSDGAVPGPLDTFAHHPNSERSAVVDAISVTDNVLWLRIASDSASHGERFIIKADQILSMQPYQVRVLVQ